MGQEMGSKGGKGKWKGSQKGAGSHALFIYFCGLGHEKMVEDHRSREKRAKKGQTAENCSILFITLRDMLGKTRQGRRKELGMPRASHFVTAIKGHVLKCPGGLGRAHG